MQRATRQTMPRRTLSGHGVEVQARAPAQVDIATHRGIAPCEFPLKSGFGVGDHRLYVDGKAAGIIEAKRKGAVLSGVGIQSHQYARGLPTGLPCRGRPLPFCDPSTGMEFHFTNGLDPEPRSRPVFAFDRPETLAAGAAAASPPAPQDMANAGDTRTALHCMRCLPPLVTDWGNLRLWPAQITAIRNLEASLAQNKPRVLILVDRGNLGRQTKKEFDQYVLPVNHDKFGEEYILQHLTRNNLDKTVRVCISTIQRMDSMLKGRELPEQANEESTEHVESLLERIGPRRSVSAKARGERAAELPNGAMSSAATPAMPDHALLLSPIEPIDYNPAFPIGTFDIIVTAEARRATAGRPTSFRSGRACQKRWCSPRVRRNQANTRWMFARPNGPPTDGPPWDFERSGM